MDFQILSSHTTVKYLRCSLCKNLLSYFPVFTNWDNENICGRCTIPQKTPYFIRNNLYEHLAQVFTFPCRYQDQGCGREFLARDIPQHEKTCPYKKIIRCPVADTYQCEWEGNSVCLLQHCRDNHLDLFIKCDGFEIDVTESNDKRYLLENNNQLFYFETKIDLSSKYFECSVYNLEDETDNVEQPWQLALKSGGRYISVEATTSKFIEKRFTDIPLEVLKSRQENFPPQVVGCITFGETGIDSKLKTLDHLKDLKCSDCSDEPVTPPLYQCFSKHVVLCKECLKKHLHSCTTCTQLLHVVHDSESLRDDDCGDEIANLLHRSCKYYEKGCSAVINDNDGDQHEKYCPFKEVKCPCARFMSCSWEGSLQKLLSHIKKDHSDRTKKCRSEYSVTVLPTLKRNSYQRFLEYVDTFFNVTYKRNNNCLEWLVQAIDTCKENYYYEIEILNGEGGSNAKKFKFGAPCSSLIQEDETTNDSKKYTCRMYLDQIEELSNNKLKYKINIKEDRRIHNSSI